MSMELVELERIHYGDLNAWETVVFHEEARVSMNDFTRMNAAMRAANEAGSEDVDIGDVPMERIPLALLAAAARRHTGNDDLTLKEAGSGFRFPPLEGDEDPEDPKGGPPETTSLGESPI